MTVSDRSPGGTQGIAKLFREARAALGLSLGQVARSTGMTDSQIHRLETGFIAAPSFVDVLTLSRFYRIPIEEVIRAVLTDEPAAHEHQGDNPKLRELGTLLDLLATTADGAQLDYALAFMKTFVRMLSP